MRDKLKKLTNEISEPEQQKQEETPQYNLITLVQVGLSENGNFIIGVKGLDSIAIIYPLAKHLYETAEEAWKRRGEILSEEEGKDN